MDEIARRRQMLFSGTGFSAALFHSGGLPGGASAPFSYFSGCSVDGSYLVLNRRGGMLLTHEMNFVEAKEKCRYPVRVFGSKPAKDLKGACGRGKIAFCPSEMSAARYFALRKKAKLRLVDAGDKIEAVRGRKSEGEVEKLAAAARIARKILARLVPWKFGTEERLAAHLKMEALRQGCEIAFEPIVAAGRNSAHPHHRSGSARLGNFVLVDFGVKKDGYCSDFTRCYFRGEGMARERETYGKCRKIHRDIVKALPKCKTGKDVALLGAKLIKEAGLPPLIHSIGHGIGMEVHEFPHLGAKSRDSLGGGTLAIEPAAYFKKFGVRYEGMVAHVKGKWREI
ncbi:MAG: M24 family metallopeptidase [Candidatus Micrarchaeota archaeon]|nr:M24 family metallopeptidase [Candidatus Micrarchaeota archaeon]